MQQYGIAIRNSDDNHYGWHATVETLTIFQREEVEHSLS
jgi:hypothetical protein